MADLAAVLAGTVEEAAKANGLWLVDVEIPKPAAVVDVGWDPKPGVVALVDDAAAKVLKLGAELDEVANIKGFDVDAVEDCPNLKVPGSVVVALVVSADLKRFTFGGAAEGFVEGTDESARTQKQIEY